MDVNDNDPIFVSPEQPVVREVPENDDNFLIVKVSANDKDLGANKEITYSLAPGQE